MESLCETETQRRLPAVPEGKRQSVLCRLFKATATSTRATFTNDFTLGLNY